MFPSTDRWRLSSAGCCARLIQSSPLLGVKRPDYRWLWHSRRAHLVPHTAWRWKTLSARSRLEKRADLVMLEKNLIDIKPEEIADIEVVYTMMNGKLTYDVTARSKAN